MPTHTDPTGRDGIGTVLKREREARGLSLDEIVARTRIQRSQLEAIEREDLHLLPPGPFVTGFVTSYARALGLRPEELLPLLPEDTLRRSARVSPSLDMEVREIPVGGNRPAAPSGVWLSLAGLVLVVVLLGVAWQSPKVKALLLQRGSAGAVGPEESGGPSSGTTSLLTGQTPWVHRAPTRRRIPRRLEQTQAQTRTPGAPRLREALGTRRSLPPSDALARSFRSWIKRPTLFSRTLPYGRGRTRPWWWKPKPAPT